MQLVRAVGVEVVMGTREVRERACPLVDGQTLKVRVPGSVTGGDHPHESGRSLCEQSQPNGVPPDGRDGP